MIKNSLLGATFCRSFAFLLIILLVLPILTNGGWVDPETPPEAMTTQPYTVIPGAIPKPDTTASSTSSSSPLSSSKSSKNITQPPTPPTSAPSSYPTSTPNTFQLVFSDEFNIPGRTFADGTDPRWTALEKNDYTNNALHYYSSSNAVTDKTGNLVITTQKFDTDFSGYNDTNGKKTTDVKHFRSAMLQTWNKFCFTGGIIEAKIQLPGKSNVAGLWPAFWLLGNLARHTYVGSSMHMWPWSSQMCTESSFYSQHISGCNKVAHFGLEAGIGRGSPEIDIFEAQPGNIKANTGQFIHSPVGQPFISASFQVAPGRATGRPGPGTWPGPGEWYEGLVGGKNTSLNIGFYGNYNEFYADPHPKQQAYWSDAISYNRQLDETHFNSPHVYRLEWDVPTDEKDGYLHWFLDGELVFAINGTEIRNAGIGSEISTEPSYILLNTAVSPQWGFPLDRPKTCIGKAFDCNSKDALTQSCFSTGFCQMMSEKDPEYKVDYVRVYQNPTIEEQKVGCSTPERPTRRYIQAHEELYKTEHDKHPLKPIPSGHGVCNPRIGEVGNDSCGGVERGVCTEDQVCECKEGWTGPNCLAAVGYDDIVWDEPDTLQDVGFVPPSLLPSYFLISLAVLLVILCLSMQMRKRMEGWSPIPESAV